jgi:hypothetical protein
MVDLKELQKEIDILLSEETDESLLNWYNELINKKPLNLKP